MGRACLQTRQYAQVLPQHGLAGFIGSQRSSPVAMAHQQVHQRPVPVLVQRVELQASPGQYGATLVGPAGKRLGQGVVQLRQLNLVHSLARAIQPGLQ